MYTRSADPHAVVKISAGPVSSSQVTPAEHSNQGNRADRPPKEPTGQEGDIHPLLGQGSESLWRLVERSGPRRRLGQPHSRAQTGLPRPRVRTRTAMFPSHHITPPRSALVSTAQSLTCSLSTACQLAPCVQKSQMTAHSNRQCRPFRTRALSQDHCPPDHGPPVELYNLSPQHADAICLPVCWCCCCAVFVVFSPFWCCFLSRLTLLVSDDVLIVALWPSLAPWSSVLGTSCGDHIEIRKILRPPRQGLERLWESHLTKKLLFSFSDPWMAAVFLLSLCITANTKSRIWQCSVAFSS
jgi:hypothetical protein